MSIVLCMFLLSLSVCCQPIKGCQGCTVLFDGSEEM
uniref:Uncharacterized protein n=1 Tax=Anguilla anguilla TaxID=7936 RepID=A0A0E9TYI9_ANGAN